MTSGLQALIGHSVTPNLTVTELHRRLGDIHRRCEAHGVSTMVLGVGRFSRRPTLTAVDGKPWMVTPWSADPLVVRGEMAVPRAQRRRLARLARLDLDVAEVLIAHEMPRAWGVDSGGTNVVSRPLLAGEWDLLRTAASIPPPAATIALGRGMAAAIDQLARIAARAGATVGQAAQASASALAATVDPVLIGVVADRQPIWEGDPAGFIVLAQWDW